MTAPHPSALHRSALAFTPGSSPIHRASEPAAIALLASLAVIAFLYSSPLVLLGAGVAAAAAGALAGAGRAVAVTLRWGAVLAALMIAVNALVTSRGETVLVRGWELPVIGPMDVTLESIAAGGVIGLRVVVVLLAFAVYSACVDPDGVLRLLRPLARRSALTAALVTRLVPLAAADGARLGEAAALRGPGAAPAGRAALARRLLAGSLDRAVDMAATLELRGYGLGMGGRRAPLRRSRHDGAMLGAAVGLLAVGIGGRIAGAGGFETYPVISLDADPLTVGVALAVPAIALLPFGLARLGRLPRPPREARGG
jgi:energy-coupling factor transport system permease protein